MKYILEKEKNIAIHISGLSVSKFIFFILFLYLNWYKEIWGDKSIILYGSVIALTLSLVIPLGKAKQLDFGCMTVFFKVLLVFGLYCFFSGIIVCKDRSLFLSSMVTYFCFLIVLFDCCLISQREGNWDWILKILLITALVCGLYTIVAGKPRGNGGATVITLGPHNNPNTLAHVMIIGIYATVVSKRSVIKKQILTVLIVLLLSYVVVQTGSRKGLISIGILLLIWIISNIRLLKWQANKRTYILSLIGIILFISVIIWYFRTYYKDSAISYRFMRLMNDEEDSANADRVQLYEFAFSLWKEHPIFGVGFNQFRVHCWENTYSHSVYAEVLSCTGTIGFLIIFVPVVHFLYKSICFAKSTYGEQKYIYIMYMAGMLTELFLGVGNIWIYGVNHELFLLCIMGLFEYQTRGKIVDVREKEVNRQCRYIF